MFGLPGLLCTISGNNQRSEPLEIFGPVGLRRFIRTSLELSRTMLGFSYIVHEMKVLPCQIPPDVQVSHISISYVPVIISLLFYVWKICTRLESCSYDQTFLILIYQLCTKSVERTVAP